ncbi:hypothetical protein APHAL10511_006836 [Amanita phalloides]|nr:hypothetical protein APHAL10511_006836 [Amanita phalloides]
MVKATLTFAFFLFATLFGFVSASPLERRTVAQLKQDLDGVSNSVDAFSDQVDLLDTLGVSGLLGLNDNLGSMSSGFEQSANAMDDVDRLSDSDSRDVLARMQKFAPAFSSSMNQMAARRQNVLSTIVGTLRHGIREVANGVKRLLGSVNSKSSRNQRAAFKRLQTEMVNAAENAASSYSDQ